MSYKITNLEYGIGPWGTEFLYGLVGNPKEGQTENNVHSVTLIQGDDGKNILVDTGVDTEDPAKGELWASLITTCKGVVWALAQVDLTPEDIDIVILTHAHLDHIGGVGRFKNAQFFIQQKEFEAWEQMATNSDYAQATLPAAYPPDYPLMREMIADGQVTLLNGDVTNFLPGIDIHVVYDCHSVAEQIVVVTNGPRSATTEDSAMVLRNEQGDIVKTIVPGAAKAEHAKKYLIAGDIALRPANLVGMGGWKGFLAPILGRSGSMLNVFKAYEWALEQIEGDMTRLVLTHDITMRERFKSEETEDGLHINYIC